MNMQQLTTAVYCLIQSVLVASLLLICSTGQAIERLTYYHNDALGSPVAATDRNGTLLWRETYAPYGERLTREAGNKDTVWYTGKQEEATFGINYFGARWYDPRIGRFMGVDPAGFNADDIQSFNKYAYAKNNPYVYVDPDGREVTITIERQTYSDKSITSTLNVISDKTDKRFSGYAMENIKGGAKHDKLPVDEGTYSAFVRTEHDPNRIELNDVERYENIQIHNGSYPDNSNGCFLAGKTKDTDYVGQSRDAMKDILGVIKADGSGDIVVNVVGQNKKPEEKK